MEELRVLSLVLVELVHVVNETLVDSDLNILFKRQLFVSPVLQIDVSLLGNEQISLAEILLVRVQLLLEQWNITSCVLLAEVSQLFLVFSF